MPGAQGIDIALLSTALVLGLRHGIDWDHIAAISDVTATEPTARRAFGRATIYAAGHASVVLALGSVASWRVERTDPGRRLVRP